MSTKDDKKSEMSASSGPSTPPFRRGRGLQSSTPKVSLDPQEKLKILNKELNNLEILLGPYEKFVSFFGKAMNCAKCVSEILENAKDAVDGKAAKDFNAAILRFNAFIGILGQLENAAKLEKLTKFELLDEDNTERKNREESEPTEPEDKKRSKTVVLVSYSEGMDQIEEEGKPSRTRSKDIPKTKLVTKNTTPTRVPPHAKLAAWPNHSNSSPNLNVTSLVKSEGQLAVRVGIPIIGANQTMTFPVDWTIKSVKSELMKKVKRAGIKNTNPASYYINARGLRILDENVHLAQLFPNTKELAHIDLNRPFEYEINVPDSPAESCLIVHEHTLVSEVAARVSKITFPNNDYKKYTFTLYGSRFGRDLEKLEPTTTFISHGFREHDKLAVSSELKEGGEKEVRENLVIQYSPFQMIDTQKNIVKRKGWLKKQGGSKGGNKAWKRRFFDLDDNVLAYYEDANGKLKGVVNMIKFIQVIQEPPEVKGGKTDDLYFAIEESNRRIILRTKTREEMEGWMESLRKYADLIRQEISYNVKIYLPEDIPGMESKVMKEEMARSLFRKRDFQPAVPVQSISSPFAAVKLFSVNADWQWNSADNPLETFEFKEELGVGACGAVYKAEHKKLTNFALAVKIVKAGNKQVQEDLEKEMEILKKARSENIVGYYGTILREKDTWILMDYCGVGSVKDVMKVTTETLTETQCQYVVHWTIRGLAYMHNLKILHLDVKAANILLTETGIVKLADFGVSQVLKTNELTKEQNDYVGSPLFMAPEVIRKEGYNEKADTWGLGITIIEMVQGRPPNTDINTIEKLPLLAERDPPKLTGRNWSSAFTKFLATCLVKDVKDRPAAKDLLLEPFMAPNVVSGKECLQALIYECISLQSCKRKKITDISQVVQF